ncbi:Na+/H+ antiporter subunit G [bacterium 3DAC]|jgi:multicomponent Na+:H+ antiporter subunit G|nr:monovalent cation/H(+) antiporter subunit G [Dictyoglomota bacterium]UZN22562.1 Na+/H+ antiporter subunit G [bacterium 3DAC]
MCDRREIFWGLVVTLLIIFFAASPFLPKPYNIFSKNVVGWTFMSIGVFFVFLGSLGLVRMPDLYCRMQTATKVTTLGALSMLLGVSILDSSGVFVLKAIVIGVFLLLTAPISASVLIRAAHDEGVPLTEETQFDRYEESKAGEEV